ncbi:MAG: TVP38/TMEM64 family protein [Candidatus Binatia bacterium]
MNGATQRAEDGEKALPLSRPKFIFLFLLVLALPLLWRWTPLDDWINLHTILEWQRSLRNDPAAIFYVIAAYLVGSLIFFPITILTLATVFAFGPLWGNVYALAGWLLSAAEGYLLGRLIGQEVLHVLAGERFGRLIDRANHHGFWAVLAVRVVPVAPFTLINMFVGASGIRFRDFFLASLVGRAPGILTLALFGVHLESALRKPGLASFALLVIILVGVPIIVSRMFRRFYDRQRD